MFRTIILGTCVLVQGLFVRRLADGRMVVQVGDRLFSGPPVSELPAGAALR